jgi:hypothetical protein
VAAIYSASKKPESGLGELYLVVVGRSDEQGATMLRMTKTMALLAAVTIVSGACGPPPEVTPALTPENAFALLENDNKAKDWMTYARKQDSTCAWKMEIPDQSSHPIEVEVAHIMNCRVTTSPRALDARATFTFNKREKRWELSQFSS